MIEKPLVDPDEYFFCALEKLWDDQTAGCGYFSPKTSIWHLPDGRHFKVEFTEITLGAV